MAYTRSEAELVNWAIQLKLYLDPRDLLWGRTWRPIVIIYRHHQRPGTKHPPHRSHLEERQPWGNGRRPNDHGLHYNKR